MFIFVFSNKQFLQQINVKMSIYSAGSRTHELSNITTREGSCPAVSLFDNTFMYMQQYVVGVVENFQTIVYWAVVVVKWSACSPSTPTIRVWIPLKPTILSVKFVFEKNTNKQKEAAVDPFF